MKRGARYIHIDPKSIKIRRNGRFYHIYDLSRIALLYTVLNWLQFEMVCGRNIVKDKYRL